MTLNLHLPTNTDTLKPHITVVGVGGAGGNAVNNMITAQLEGVNFVVANTDAQALGNSLAERVIQLGVGVTSGLGAGASPDVGRAAAEESIGEIEGHLQGSNMVFITAGMGGGTGTGAAPVIARMAREMGILTVGVVTKPFQFEGAHRMRVAEQGLDELQKYVDTLIVIPNQNLFRIANEKTTFADAFSMADNVLHSGVRGVTDLMVMPGLINLDFADIRAVMREMGKAVMGTGQSDTERRAVDAAEAAISNPLLDDMSMKGARGMLINVTGGPDLTLFEVDEVANRVREEVDSDANIIFGATFNPEMEGQLRVTVVATGIDVPAQEQDDDSAGGGIRSRVPLFRHERKETPAIAPAEPVATKQPEPVAAKPLIPELLRSVSSSKQDAGAQESLEMATAESAPQVKGEQEARQPEMAVAQNSAGYVPPRPVEPSISPSSYGRPVGSFSRVEQREYSTGSESRSSESGRFNIMQKFAGVSKVLSSMSDGREEQGEEQVMVRETTPPAPAKTSTASEGSDEYLDIPAFLRRQAN